MSNKDTAHQITQDLFKRCGYVSPYSIIYGSRAKDIKEPANMQEYSAVVDAAIHLVGQLTDNLKRD